jgi:hypothetical protein
MSRRMLHGAIFGASLGVSALMLKPNSPFARKLASQAVPDGLFGVLK